MKVTGQQYWDLHTDVKNAGIDPLFHYLIWGQVEGRRVDMPELPPDWNWQVYVNAYPDLQTAGIDTQAKAENHYLTNGYKEGNGQYGRWPVPGQPQPHPSGLSLIYEWHDKKEAFCHLNGWTGRYGLHEGGADLCLNHDVKQILPDRESVFTMLDDLCTTELYAGIYRLENGTWIKKYSRSRLQDLMLGLVKRANGQYVGLWTGWDNLTSGLVYSNDKDHWTDGPMMKGRAFSGIYADGNTIRLAGRIGTAQAVADENGNILASMDNGRGFWYWSICGPYVGTWNSNPAYGGYIDRQEGNTLSQVYDNDNDPHRYIQSIVRLIDNSYLAVATNDWDAPKDKTTLLLSWADGGKPKEILKIPLPHVMNLFPTADGGADICGGRYRDFGTILHWRP